MRPSSISEQVKVLPSISCVASTLNIFRVIFSIAFWVVNWIEIRRAIGVYVPGHSSTMPHNMVQLQMDSSVLARERKIMTRIASYCAKCYHQSWKYCRRRRCRHHHHHHHHSPGSAILVCKDKTAYTYLLVYQWFNADIFGAMNPM